MDTPVADGARDEPLSSPDEEFEAFFRAQYSSLVKFVRRRIPGAEDAEDAAQESMTRFVRYSKTEPAEAWAPTLYRIAINVMNDQGRRTLSQSTSRHVSLDDVTIESESPNAEEETALAQQRILLRDAILALPPKCKQVYLLKRLKGMRNSEIAKHCGISVKMVEKHTANAILHIRKRLGHVASGAYEGSGP